MKFSWHWGWFYTILIDLCICIVVVTTVLATHEPFALLGLIALSFIRFDTIIGVTCPSCGHSFNLDSRKHDEDDDAS